MRNNLPECTTDGSGKDKNKSCQFPFKFRGKFHSECITEGSKDGRAWCATAVDKKRNQMKGKWGNCDANTCHSLKFDIIGTLDFLPKMYSIAITSFNRH